MAAYSFSANISTSGGAGDAIGGIIQAAWDSAASSQSAAESFAGNAVSAASALLPGFDNFQPVEINVENYTSDNDVRAAEKARILDNDVNNALLGTIPGAYGIFGKAMSQTTGLGSIFGGTFDSEDAMKIVGTLSDSFNDQFIFGDAASNGSLAGTLKDMSEFLMTGIMYEGESHLQFGLPASVEEAIRSRAYDSIDREILRAEQDAVSVFASRGFPAPPGVLNRVAQEARDKALRAKGDLNREVLIDQNKRGFDATMKYIDVFRDIQQQTQSAFIEYMNSIINARSQVTEDMKSLMDAVVKLRGSIIGLFNYVDQERDILLREAVAEHEIGLKQKRLELDNFRSRIDGRINATISAAQSMGQLAAAALGSQNTMASLAEETITEG